MGKRNVRNSVLKLVYAAVCLALALVLPFLTGQIPQIANKISPMHIPVFICGFACGPTMGLVVGAIAPILRSILFGMPVMMPKAIAMAFELAAYGAFAGLFYRLFSKKPFFIYMDLILAMIIGRLVWGMATFILLGISGTAFTFEAFLAGALLNAIPGIVLHILLIPPVVIALRKAGLID